MMDFISNTSSTANITNTTTSCNAGSSMFEGFDELMVFCYVVVIATATPGNALLIFVVRRNPSMQTFTNFMICNCAFSDLLRFLLKLTLLPPEL